MDTASPWSWVTKMVVSPNWSISFFTSPRVCRRRAASRFENGSSSSSTRGLWLRQRARATRCFSPPDKLRGIRPSSFSKPMPMMRDVAITLASMASGFQRRRRK